MIIQCDQCSTKFKLDDAKVSEKGTKVRCSKCKHIFIVQKDTFHEEPDLDSLLSGLGASLSDSGTAQASAAAPPAATGEEWQPFSDESVATREKPDETTVAGGMEQAGKVEFGEDFFSTKEVTAAVPQEDNGFDFGENAVEEEQASLQPGAAVPPEAASTGTEGFEFGEFPFEEEPAPPPSAAAAEPEAASGEAEGFTFGEFAFEEEKIAAPADTPVAAEDVPVGKDGFDFESAGFDSGESAEIKAGGGLSGIPTGEFEEEVFTFGEEPTVPQGDKESSELKMEHPQEAEEAFDFGTFAVPSPEENEAASAFPVSPAAGAVPFVPEEERKVAETEPLDFGDIDFGESMATGSAATKRGVNSGVGAATIASGTSTDNLSAPSLAPQMPSADEELPPLSISTRKKGRSVFPIAVTAIAVLVALAIAGVGFLVFKEGSAAFDKLGLGFVAKWVGLEGVEEGGIAIKNPVGAFITNREAGEIFVVNGEAVNNFRKPRASIQVRATILGPKGQKLMEKSAYCGNVLSKDQLATLPMAKIEGAMGNQFGDSLTNLGVPPGKGIPFVIVFSGVPKEAAEFSVDVVGSTVASQ